MREARLVTVLLILASAGLAEAQETSIAPAAGAEDQEVPSEARQRFALAQQAFEQGDFAIALTEWERVYALLDGHPNREYVSYNMARAQEELGRTRQALELYERFLSATSNDAPSRSDAQRHAQELRARLQLDQASSEAGSGGSEAVSGGLAPSPVGIAIASVGAAALIAGAIVGGLAVAQDAAARPDCDATRCSPDAYASLTDAHTLANAADGLLWGGLAVLAVGAVLTFVLGESTQAEASAMCSDDGCLGTVQGRF